MEGYIFENCGREFYGFFDGQHHEPTEMTREELEDFVNFLQNLLDK